MERRRVSVPIAMAVGLVAMTIALTVGWQILVVRENAAWAEGFTAIHWVVAIMGSAFFIAIMGVTILFATWLVQEIRSNQRQQNFIDAVTHELHTPLASLQLYLDTLRGQSLDDEKRDEFLGVMAVDLARLHRTIDQILQAARTEVRRVRRDPVPLASLLAECAEAACERHDLDADSVKLDVPAHARVRGDPVQLEVAFRNLIDNAIRYAGEQVHVDVRVRPVSARRLEIEVADRGVGIPESAIGRVFLRFQRISHEAVRAPRGLGLGLYIVRNIVRSHRGDVRAESDGEGLGSRFIVTLPGFLDERPNPVG